MIFVDYSIVAKTKDGQYLDKNYKLTNDLNEALCIPNEKCWKHDTKWYFTLNHLHLEKNKFYKQKVKDEFRCPVTIRTEVTFEEREEQWLQI
ncbi:hypothetical protein [Clostridium sp.]|uniref:hypothetical protein n=1 Tax=Clostridium sp. TaxID=1506 RepID=UPI002618F1A1|nr:hypothetical protein [Clostridium sp.]